MKPLANKGTSQLLRVWIMLAAVALAGIPVASLGPLEANATGTLPSGFQEVFSGLTDPTNVEFSQDGRVFVAEKSIVGYP
jgi:hypothetical protein